MYTQRCPNPGCSVEIIDKCLVSGPPIDTASGTLALARRLRVISPVMTTLIIAIYRSCLKDIQLDPSATVGYRRTWIEFAVFLPVPVFRASDLFCYRDTTMSMSKKV
jgi:hypothetical protein